jgi:LysM repeat protein
MERKKTILIAVFINAGLLAVLFITALSSHIEEDPHYELTQVQASKPLFPNEADTVLQQAPSMPVPIQITAVPTQQVLEMPVTPEVVIHKLPKVAVETPVAVVHKEEPAGLEITVKKGDSLDKIAKAHHTTVDEMIRINQLPGSFLRVGQVLKIPEGKASVQKKSPVVESVVSAAEYYTVKVGDNPWGIAMKHHMKLEELLQLNHLNEDKARKLKPGDRLRIK